LAGRAISWPFSFLPVSIRLIFGNDERFIKIAAQHKSVTNRFWLSVGDQETEVDEPPEVSQIVGVKNACRVLKSLGAIVHYHEYHGGHDLKYWREELAEALLWLLADHN
jgi:predicted alpha/beta superfamily hydrolase